MKIAVVGSRGLTQDFVYVGLFCVLDALKPTEIVSGGAIGPDRMGERYAKEKGIPCTVFKPDWNKHGNSAGILRNQDIVDASDMVVAVWDGLSKGTKNVLERAEAAGKKSRIVYCVNCDDVEKGRVVIE